MFENHGAVEIPGRPAPVQRRGIERVQAILDAAESLLEEQGYAAATLKAISDRAGIPIASVYHYFADRHQVDAELVQRGLTELDARLVAALDNSKLRTLNDLIDVVIDEYLAYFREHPSFVQLWFAGRTPTLEEVARAFDETQAQRFWELLIHRKLIHADTPQLAVQLAFEAGNRLFDVAFRRARKGDDATVGETRRLIAAYLQTYASQAPRRSKRK